MAVTLRITNFDQLNVNELGQLDADVLPSNDTLTVVNSQDFANDSLLYIGRLGSENGEVVTVDSTISPTSLSISPALRNHSRFDSIYGILADKLKVYRATNVDGTEPADTAYSVLATISIDYDQPMTTYTDVSGDSNHWYKFTYFNSTLSQETDLADSGASRGASSGSNYCSIQDIRDEASFTNNRYITDGLIDSKRQFVQSQINGRLYGRFDVPFKSPINPTIKLIAQTWAAGLLMIEQYGSYGTQNTSNGNSKIELVTNKDGTGWLDKLQSGAMDLIDATGASTEISGAIGSGSWPNETTAAAEPEDGGAERLFRISDIQGYRSRKY